MELPRVVCPGHNTVQISSITIHWFVVKTVPVLSLALGCFCLGFCPMLGFSLGMEWATSVSEYLIRPGFIKFFCCWPQPKCQVKVVCVLSHP